MTFIEKILKVLMILVVIYLWNRFIIKTMLKNFIALNKRRNEQNTYKQPINFLVENEVNIIKYAQYFYWFGGILSSISLLVNE